MKLIQQVTSWFLIAQMSLTILMYPLFVLDYELRKDYIAEVLCINKDVEQTVTVCYGKCYVQNKIKILEEEQKETTTEQTSSSLLVLTQPPVRDLNLLQKLFFSKVSNLVPYLKNYEFQFHFRLKNPPQQLA